MQFIFRRSPVLWAVAAVAVWSLAVFGVIGGYQAQRPRVPSFVGLTLDEAQQVASDSRLSFSSQGCDDLPDQFCVVRTQRPSEGTVVDDGDTVNVSLAATDVETPNVVGLTITEASDVFGELALDYESNISADAMDGYLAAHLDEAEWLIAAQNPSAGEEVRAGSTVQVEFTLPTFALEDFTGLALVDARVAAQTQGLGMTASTTAPAGAVVAAQQPAAGTTVEFGTEVVVDLSVPVPRTNGENFYAQLADAGLEVEVQEGADEREWTFAGTLPAAGTMVSVGSTVTALFEQPSMTFTVTGNVSRANVNLYGPADEGNYSNSAEPLPFSRTFLLDEIPPSWDEGSLNASSSDGGTLTCTITLNGEVISQDTDSSPYYTSAYCY